MGITAAPIDKTLYERLPTQYDISVAANKYHVIMEVAPRNMENPETLKDV